MLPKHHPTLLLVEDEPIVAMTERLALEKYGYSVVHASTGEAAIAAMDSRRDIDLILMDIDLGPGIDGTETAERILADRAVPVVFVSSHSERGIVEKTERITSYGYVVKNSSIAALDASIKMAFKLFDEKKARQEIARRLSFACEAGGVGIWEFDVPENRLLWDRQVYRLFGTAPECHASAAQAWAGIVHPDDKAPSERALAKSLRDEQDYDDEFRIVWADGSTHDIHSIAKIQRDADGVARSFIGINYEITGSKNAQRQLQAKNEELESVNEELLSTTEELKRQNEELLRVKKKLQESEAAYRSFITASPDDVTMTDLQGTILFVSPMTLKLLKCRETDLVGKSLMDFMIPQERERAAANLALMFKRGNDGPGEYHAVRSDGSIVDVEANAEFIRDAAGTPTKVLYIIRDISERKRNERVLEKSEERLEFVLQGAQLGYWDWDLKTNRVLRNEQWANMLGYSLAEIEETFEQGVTLQHPDDREVSWKSIQDHLEGRTDSYRITYRLKKKDGSFKWILDTGRIMERDEKGNPLRLCGTHTDIDEQKKADEKIQHLLAEKEIVLKEVHHRIKNNMNTMRSLLALQAGNNKDPAAREALEDAGKRMRSMECLYDKLYRADNFSMLSTTAYLPPLIDEIIANFPESRMVKVDKRIQEFELEAKRLQPLGILINELLTNTMKYAFAGRDAGAVTVTASLRDGMITISVEDDGTGIPESLAFDDSAGFGFQLVHALAYQLQGAVRLEPCAGTKVVLEFRK